MTGETSTQITLRALEGEPLKHDRIREMIIATAHAIAERQGVKVIDLQTTSSAITARLDTGRIEAIGFASELRRLTTSWYCHKFGVDTLWGKADGDDYDAGEEWKSA